MKPLHIETIIQQLAPRFLSSVPRYFHRPLTASVKYLLAIKRIDHYLQTLSRFSGEDFIDEVFEQIDCTFTVSYRDIRRIPLEGPLIIVANHPLGALDSLALVRAVRTIRPEVRIVANDILTVLEPLRDILIPVGTMSGTIDRASVHAIHTALENQNAIIMFPAAEVSRFNGFRVMDGRWRKGAAKLSLSHHATITPVHIEARNSMLFYLLSLLWNPLGTLLLPREMLKKRGTSIRLRIGNPIPPSSLKSLDLAKAAQMLRRHVYNLKSDREVLATQEPLPRPMDVRALRHELHYAQLLGLLPDGKHIYVAQAQACPGLMREIGRLRELTFRSVQEGTGLRLDIDRYDQWYDQLVLWDDEELTIVGAYRLAPCRALTSLRKVDKLYTSEHYHFSTTFRKMLPESLELGRSFLQRRYWNTNALDYLWKGIGAYLSFHPDIRYLFGTVSLSDAYPREAKVLIVNYYRKWFGAEPGVVRAKTPFIIAKKEQQSADVLLNGIDHREDFRKLKEWLKKRGLAIPTLFRQYVELCETGGARFLEFAVDEEFNACVDGFIMLDLHRITSEKRERYLGKSKFAVPTKETEFV